MNNFDLTPEELEEFQRNIKVGDLVAVRPPIKSYVDAANEGRPGLFDNLTVTKLHHPGAENESFELKNLKYDNGRGSATWSFMPRDVIFPTKEYVIRKRLKDKDLEEFGDFINTIL